jgi:hypothetical protein
MPVLLVKARCRIFEPNYRIIRSQFDVEPAKDYFPEYVVMNLMRERGVLLDGKLYWISAEPAFPH